MSVTLITVIVISIMLLTVLSGIHVALGVGLAGLVGAFIVFGGNLHMLSALLWGWASNYTFAALILFVMMGEFASASGMSRRMYDSASLWLTKLPGGLLHVNIASCAVFAALTGSSVATSATIGSIGYPEQKRLGYHSGRSLSSICAGGTLGILIPPSVIMIFYGIITETSIVKLYLAGFLPGIMMAVLFMLYILVHNSLSPMNLAPPEVHRLKERLASLVHLVPATVLILGMMTFLYLGLSTATELGAIGVIFVIVISTVERVLSWKAIRQALLSTVRISSMVFMLLVAGGILSTVLVNIRLGIIITEQIVSWGLPWQAVFVFVCLIYLILGMLIDAFSIMVLTMPVIFPVMTGLGVDPVWLGIETVVLIEMAAITPPFGMNLFVVDGISGGTHLGDIIRGNIPYVALLMMGVALLVFFPQIALLLPRLRFGG
jgi:tripartite ATP-independent transporter DctM subunit